MMYHAITKDDMKNGMGLRIVLWVSGCEHKCPECHNPQTWCAEKGEPFTYWEEAELFKLLKQEHISGITFSGGDPLHPANRDTVGRLAKQVSEMEGKDVWLYTGYKLRVRDGSFIFCDEEANLPDLEIDWLSCIDVLVDGRYQADVRKDDIFRGADPHWRGSSNQNLVDVKSTLKEGRIVCLDGKVVSNNDVYSHCISHYKDYQLGLNTPLEMLALVNILEAHNTILEELHSFEGGGFCHMFPSSSEDKDLVQALFSNNAFFFTKEAFLARMNDVVLDCEITKVVLDNHNCTHTVYRATEDGPCCMGTEIDNKYMTDDVIAFIQSEDNQCTPISSAVCEYTPEAVMTEETFEELLQQRDIIKTTDGYVHVNLV